MLLKAIVEAVALAVFILFAAAMYASCVVASKADKQSEEQFERFMKEREQRGNESRSDGNEREDAGR